MVLYAAIPALMLSANTVDLTTTDVLGGKRGFDNLKATWGKALEIAGIKSSLECTYDYAANKDFIKSATLSGDLQDSDDLTVSYEVSHDFGSDKTSAVLTAVSSGTTVKANYDTEDSLTEVTAERTVDTGFFEKKSTDVSVGYLVKSQTARVKLMSAVGDDTISASVDYSQADSVSGLELGYQRSLKNGQDMTATFSPEKKNMEVELVDSNFESGATWTATASVPLDDPNAIATLFGQENGVTLSLKRSWNW
jgi:hypothetical protein